MRRDPRVSAWAQGFVSSEPAAVLEGFGREDDAFFEGRVERNVTPPQDGRDWLADRLALVAAERAQSGRKAAFRAIWALGCGLATPIFPPAFLAAVLFGVGSLWALVQSAMAGVELDAAPAVALLAEHQVAD